MEDSWEDLVSQLEIGDDDFFNQRHMKYFNEEEFLRDISQRPVFSPESESPSNSAAAIADSCGAATATSPTDSSLSLHEKSFKGHGTLRSNSSNSIISLDKSSLSPTTYILSFDNSIVEPAIHKRYSEHGSALGSSKRSLRNHSSEPKGTKKIRNSTETEEHIMAERKRRQELTRSIIALSATIPGLKKADKAYVLREAVNYVKQLQERVRELESQNRKRCVDSIIFIKKTQLCKNEATPPCETNTDGCYTCIEELPEIEARALDKEVLIGIHCQKQKGSLLKIFSSLKNLHLSISSTSVLPFGTSTVKITIIAQMDDEYNLTMDVLVKTLRQHLLKSNDMQR